LVLAVKNIGISKLTRLISLTLKAT
ncbi:phenylalanine--tRNA ligase, beta subunit, partial [Vibrio parahaemolyticus EKP-021]